MRAILLLGTLLLLLAVGGNGDSYARILAEQMAGEGTTTMMTTMTTEKKMMGTDMEDPELDGDKSIVGEKVNEGYEDREGVDVEEEDGDAYGYDYVEGARTSRRLTRARRRRRTVT